ncbi:MAG: hypothetical protein ACLRHW_15150 [Coprobacillus cateniformis]
MVIILYTSALAVKFERNQSGFSWKYDSNGTNYHIAVAGYGLSNQMMHDRWFFLISMSGHYPYALKMFERKGFHIDITEEVRKSYKGTVDYMGFLIYDKYS